MEAKNVTSASKDSVAAAQLKAQQFLEKQESEAGKAKSTTQPNQLRHKYENSLNYRYQEILEETDPNNPYGPNYYFLPRQAKTYYKYLRLCKFVHIEKEDEEAILTFNYLYYGGLGFSLGLGYQVGRVTTSTLLKPLAPSLYAGMKSNRSIFLLHGAFASLAGSLAYFKLNDFFSVQYVDVLTRKYLPIAVKNGFKDYSISPDKK